MTRSASGRPGDAQAVNIMVAAGGSSSPQCFVLPVNLFLNGDTLESFHEGCHGPSSPSRALEDVSGSPASIFTSRAEG